MIRTPVDTVNPTGRDTMGVRLINLKDGDTVVGVARNAEVTADDLPVGDTEDGTPGPDAAGTGEAGEGDA